MKLSDLIVIDYNKYSYLTKLNFDGKKYSFILGTTNTSNLIFEYMSELEALQEHTAATVGFQNHSLKKYSKIRKLILKWLSDDKIKDKDNFIDKFDKIS